MLTKNIADMTAKIDAHRVADLLVQGEYFDAETGKGCFIGCLAHKNDATIVADKYGIPVELTCLLAGIFEALPKNEAADFFTAIPRAIGFDKKDLSRVVWQFLAEELRALPKQPNNVQNVIDPVIAVMNLKASGQEWPAAHAAHYAAPAAHATNYVAYTATHATLAATHAALAATFATFVTHAALAATHAANAATSVTHAAHAARIRQRDTILRLMIAAPILGAAT